MFQDVSSKENLKTRGVERISLQQFSFITWTNLVNISYCSLPETFYGSVQIGLDWRMFYMYKDTMMSN